MPSPEYRRLQLLAEHRRRKGLVHRAEQMLRHAAELVDDAKERAAEAEYRFAAELRRNGPLEDDGRIYRAEYHDGLLVPVAYVADSAVATIAGGAK